MIKPFAGRGAWCGEGWGTDARVPLTDETAPFTVLSARLTGFDTGDLVATGLTDVYRAVGSAPCGTPVC